VTDFEGKFTLKCKQGASLQVSYVGYQTQTVAASANMEIIMQDDAAVLENVVVIGYGVAKKTDLTGSVTAIKPDEKNHGLITNAQEMIQGKVAGVNVSTSSGAPGEGAQIRIRGGASLNASNDPLIVIDGLPMDANGTKGVANPLSLVNPNDIESFTVLKDASATAIYGSRGSNGVIIITTKRGRRNQAPQVTYNGNVSVSTVSKKLDLMNASDFRNYILTNYGPTGKYYNEKEWDNVQSVLGNNDTDWQDEIYRNGVSTDHNVTVAGGVGNTKWSMPYRASIGYTDQQGTLRGSNYNRFTVGFTLNPSLLDDHLNININGKYAYSNNNPGNTSAIGSATAFDPTRSINSDDERMAPYNGYWEWVDPTSVYKDPNYSFVKNSDAPSNPMEQINQYNFSRYNNTLLGNAEFDYKIHGFEDLRLHLNLAGEYTYGCENTSQAPHSTAAYFYGNYGWNQEKKYNTTLQAYLQYYKDFTEKHHFDIMGGYEHQHMKYWGDSKFWGYYPATTSMTDDDGNALAGTYRQASTPAEWEGQTYIVSFYGRMNYSYADRYLFTFTARGDGSSRFADGHRWGFFPSAAFAWKINEESFLKDVTSISDFKLRLGWGKTGQQNTGMEYYTPTYKVTTNNHYTYPVGGNGNTGVLYRPLVYNNELTWETTSTYNVGIDYAMFKNRLTLSVDAYYRKTTDLLNTSKVPTGTNFDNAVMTNAGELENKGIEVAIGGKPVQTKDWLVDATFNIGYNKNEITELYGGYDMIEAGLTAGTDSRLTYHKVGLPASSFYVYQQVYDENGLPIQGCYVDRNGDGVIDDGDRYFYKNITAPWQGGFALKIAYKNWDLGTNLRYSLGNYVYNGIVAGKVNSAEAYNSKGFLSNIMPLVAQLGWTSYDYALSDYFVQNASFLKCDNITLGYNFENLFKTANYKGISGRIYGSCTNVFTITKYDGLDPEQTSGYEGSVYPRSRTYLVGLSLQF
jgi:iron complex outermembrane receptor protein